MKNHELIRVLKEVTLSALEAGDCEKAVKILDAAIVLCNDDGVIKVLEKAKEQADIGSPEVAETLLEFSC